MDGHLVLIGRNRELLLDLSIRLRGEFLSTTIALSPDPIARAALEHDSARETVVICLDDEDNAADAVRLAASNDCAVFIADDHGSAAAIAVREAGAQVLSAAEACIVLAASRVGAREWSKPLA